MDLAFDIPQIVFSEALAVKKPLVAVREQLDGDAEDTDQAIATMALLQVCKTISEEATAVFYAMNTFKLSLYPVLGRPSLFTRHAIRFRRIVLQFSDPTQEEFDLLQDSSFQKDTRTFLINLWKKQISALTPTCKLQLLELDVRSLVWNLLLISEVSEQREKVVRKLATRDLKPKLDACLPSVIWRQGNTDDLGVVVFFFNLSNFERDEIREAFTGLDIRFK